MSWNVALIENTVKINETIAEDLFDAQEYEGEIWEDLENVMHKGKLYFNSDHNEGIDYLGNERIQEILNKHKVKGSIKFGSLEGDNSGDFWGYSFDGKGGMKTLTGKVKWTED